MKKIKIIAIISVICALMTTTLFSAPTYAGKIKISRKTITIRTGSTYKLKIKGTDKKVKWSSSKKKIAAVNSNGKVKAKKKGKTTIIAKVNGRKYKCRVRVIGENDYNRVVTEKYIRTALNIPSKATAKFEFGKKYFWGGGGCYMVHIVVRGTGKYEGYIAFADFGMNGGSKSMWSWTYEPNL